MNKASTSAAPCNDPLQGGVSFIPSAIQPEGAPVSRFPEVEPRRRPVQLFLHGFTVSADEILQLDNVCRDLLQLPRVAGARDPKLPQPGRKWGWDSVLLVHGEVAELRDLPEYPFHQEVNAGLVVINGIVRKNRAGSVGMTLAELCSAPVKTEGGVA